MVDVDIVRERAVRLLEDPPGLMAKRLVVQLLRGALIIAVLFGVVALINHEEPPAVAAPTVATPKSDRAVLLSEQPSSLDQPVKVKLVKELAPPASVVATRDESVKPLVVQPTLISRPVEPSGDVDKPPVREQRQFKLKVDPINAKLRRYCARSGRTARSWIRVRGVKHYCAA